MSAFTLDTSGAIERPASYTGWGVERALTWRDLGPIDRAYVEAMFWTSQEELGDAGFGDLAPETLLTILQDCRTFEGSRAWADALEDYAGADEVRAGHDLWLTRNHHGAGFWDGDWPEPHASALTEAANALGETDAYLGDDGKVYLS